MHLKKENELNTVISLSVNKYVTFSFKTLHDSSFKPGTNFFLHTLISYIFTVSQILNEFHGRGRSLHSHLPTSSSLYAEHILLLCPSQLYRVCCFVATRDFLLSLSYFIRWFSFELPVISVVLFSTKTVIPELCFLCCRTDGSSFCSALYMW